MDYWPHLPPVRQLPLAYRAWAWWLRNGPKRASQGTVGGTAAFRALTWAARAISRREHAYTVLSAPDRPRLVIDLRDFQSFHHSLPVWYRGDKELEVLRAVMAPGGTYLDVGANYGVYALAVARIPDVSVIAIEPEPHLAQALRASRDANAFTNMEIVEAVLDAVIGTAQLAVGTASGTSTLQHERFSPNARKIDVTSLTVDEIITRFAVNDLRCLKLDVEGAEIRVLRGAAETLTKFHPTVVFEAGREEPQAEVFAYLRDFGYDDFRDQSSIGADAPVPPQLHEPITNVIATRSQRGRGNLNRGDG